VVFHKNTQEYSDKQLGNMEEKESHTTMHAKQERFLKVKKVHSAMLKTY
jgi:hypothetical protein